MNKDIEKLMLENKKLVYYFYNKLQKTELCLIYKEDLIQEGMIGLWKGCKSYCKEKGNTLSTYLGRCINNEMYMYFRKLNKQSNEISIDTPIAKDSNGNELTIADTLIIEDNIYELDTLNDFKRIYFKCYKKTRLANERIPIILSMLRDGYYQNEIADKLNCSRSLVNKYIVQLRNAIKNNKDVEMENG